MKVIDLTNVRSVEIWPGRRLYQPGSELLGLPKGAMALTARSLTFGSPGRTSVRITAGQQMLDAIFASIIDMERPGSDGAVKTVAA